VRRFNSDNVGVTDLLPKFSDTTCLQKVREAIARRALGRTEEAKALRERYGLTEPEKPKSS
jgi:hypothetical protein